MNKKSKRKYKTYKRKLDIPSIQLTASELDWLSQQKTPVPSFNVIEVLTESRTGERLSLLTVQAMVSNKEPKWTSVPVARDHEVKMTSGLETGATHSIMSYKAAVRHKVLKGPSELPYKTADGVVHNVAGCTKELTVLVQSSVASLKFVVIDHKDNDILLGLNFVL
jgi:hypothetical protein